MDLAVKLAQEWVNATYAGRSNYVACPESGITGWPTMRSLTRALQIEIGAGVDGQFGPGTATKMTQFGVVSASTPNVNIRTIIQCALYCKGYDGGGADGVWGPRTLQGIENLKSHMGIPASSGTVDTKMTRSLLNMDAFVVIWDGSPLVREVQQWMNSVFWTRRDFQIVPCDGIFSRGVQKGLVFAIQYSLGMADGAADGVFGPATRSALKAGEVQQGSQDAGSSHLVKLYKAALVFNRYFTVDWPSSTFTLQTAEASRSFQAFCHLPLSGRGDYATWCSLISSTGDPTRPVSGADCMTPLNQARIDSLKNAGFQIVGRYIAGGVNKRMALTEASLITANGLKFFPIFQELNNAPQYFTYSQGRAQAAAAIQNAEALTIPHGAVIYFPCDWDATDDDVSSIVLPYYQGVSSAIAEAGHPYEVGVYGTRNVCARISRAGIAVASFVAGMSSGWSGNLGYSLPPNWAFDQISGETLSPGSAGQLEIDRNVVSGRDQGVAALIAPLDPVNNFFDWLRLLESQAQMFKSQGGAPNRSVQWLTAEYLRGLNEGYLSDTFEVLCGFINKTFIASVNLPDMPPLRDPILNRVCDVPHLGAVLTACFNRPLAQYRGFPGLHDFGGWAGDLITVSRECHVELSDRTEGAGYQMAFARIGDDLSTFKAPDLIADVDAEVVYWKVMVDGTKQISDLLQPYYNGISSARTKYQDFIGLRFGNVSAFRDAVHSALLSSQDTDYATWRAGLWAAGFVKDPLGVMTPFYGVAVDSSPDFFSGIARALSDRIALIAGY